MKRTSRSMAPVKIGLVSSYRESDHKAKVELQPEGVLTDWIRVSSPIAHASWGLVAPLEKGEEVLVLVPDGSLVHAVIVSGLFGSQAPRPEAAAKSILLKHSSGASVELKNDGSLVFNGGEYHLTRFENLKTAFDSHIHPTGVGPSSTPTVPLPDTVKADKAKVD